MLKNLERNKKEANFDIVVSREDSCFIEDVHPDFVNHIVNVMHNTTTIVDDIRSVDGPILKIAICNMIDGPHIIDKYLKYLQDMFGSEIKVVTSGNIWIDFIAPGTNKGTALSKLLDVLHIKPEECIAFRLTSTTILRCFSMSVQAMQCPTVLPVSLTTQLMLQTV